MLRWLNSEIDREVVPDECVDANPARAVVQPLERFADLIAGLTRVAADPASEIARLRQSGPPYEIELALKLTPAPQLAELQRWLQPPPAPQQPRKRGFWSGLFGLMLGWALLDALFGNGCDCG